jgi:hypothetical protein
MHDHRRHLRANLSPAQARQEPTNVFSRHLTLGLGVRTNLFEDLSRLNDRTFLSFDVDVAISGRDPYPERIPNLAEVLIAGPKDN